VAAHIFDLHFHDTLARAVGRICAHISPSGTTYCTEPETGPNVIRVGELKPGRYVAYYHNKGDIDVIRHNLHAAPFVVPGKPR
jgi:hypothetical protein